MSLRERTWSILEPGRTGDRLSLSFDLAMMVLIVANITALVVETVDPIYHAAPHLFDAFETLSVLVFSAEYLLRLWCCTASERFVGPVAGRLRWALTPMALFDLAAVLPWYLPFVGIDLRFLRVFRLFRLFRVAKLARYSRALQTLGRVVVGRRDELLVSLALLLVLLLLAASALHFAEHEEQPEHFGSIPASAWWAVVTLTTVGYGDVYPVTPAGRVLGGVFAVLGIGLFAVPNGILAMGFIGEIQRQRGKKRCPHCGEEIP